MQSSSLHSPLRRATSCSVATPRSSLPFWLCPYTPTEVTRPLWLAFTASAPSSTLTRQGATALGFTPSLGRPSNCQATEDDWRWSQTRSPSCLPAEENGRLDTSTYVVVTNDLRKRLNYERLASFSPVLDVHACGGDNSNDDERANDDDTPKRPQTMQVWPAFTASRRDGDQGERRGFNVQRSMTRRE